MGVVFSLTPTPHPTPLEVPVYYPKFRICLLNIPSPSEFPMSSMGEGDMDTSW